MEFWLKSFAIYGSVCGSSGQVFKNGPSFFVVDDVNFGEHTRMLDGLLRGSTRKILSTITVNYHLPSQKDKEYLLGLYSDKETALNLEFGLDYKNKLFSIKESYVGSTPSSSRHQSANYPDEVPKKWEYNGWTVILDKMTWSKDILCQMIFLGI